MVQKATRRAGKSTYQRTTKVDQNRRLPAWGCKPVGGKVTELRFDVGSGNRVYVAERNGKLLILLIDGVRFTQQADIKKAQLIVRELEV